MARKQQKQAVALVAASGRAQAGQQPSFDMQQEQQQPMHVQDAAGNSASALASFSQQPSSRQQQGLGRSLQGSSNGSSTSGSSRLHRPRVQATSRHSSSEPSPSSQTGTLPPGWSASWQHQQTQQLRGSSTTTSRALSPVGAGQLPCPALAVAGAAVGAGQELTPAALAAAAANGSLVDAAADRLQRMLDAGCGGEGGDSGDECTATPRERRVAYHWWKELPPETLRKCDSLVSDQQAWQDYGDRPLLAKPSVRFRKTINTKKIGHDGLEYAIAVNAQHYAVLVTDVQPCGPYPELEQ